MPRVAFKPLTHLLTGNIGTSLALRRLSSNTHEPTPLEKRMRVTLESPVGFLRASPNVDLLDLLTRTDIDPEHPLVCPQEHDCTDPDTIRTIPNYRELGTPPISGVVYVATNIFFPQGNHIDLIKFVLSYCAGHNMGNLKTIDTTGTLIIGATPELLNPQKAGVSMDKKPEAVLPCIKKKHILAACEIKLEGGFKRRHSVINIVPNPDFDFKSVPQKTIFPGLGFILEAYKNRIPIEKVTENAATPTNDTFEHFRQFIQSLPTNQRQAEQCFTR